MKTTATTTWRRVLLACLCAVLSAAGESSGAAGGPRLPPTAEEAVVAGGKVVETQEFIAGGVWALWLTAKEALDAARDAVVGGEGAGETFAEVEKVAKTAEKLYTAGDEAQTAVREADRKTLGALEGALNLTGVVPGVTVTQEKVEEWKKRADEAAKLWEEAAKKTESQFLTAGRMLAEVEGARAAAGIANNDGGAALAVEARRKMEELEDRLTVLSEFTQNVKNNTENVKDLARTATDKIKEALNETFTQATAKIDNSVNVSKHETTAELEDAKTPQPQDSPRENENPTGNDDRGDTPTKETEAPPHDSLGSADNKTTTDDGVDKVTVTPTSDEANEDPTSDGSPLTVSRRVTTSVLLLLARVAAVMISA